MAEYLNCKGQRTKHCGMTCQEVRALDEQNMRYKACSEQEDSCPGNAYKKAGSRREEKSLNKQSTCHEACSKQENSCPGNAHMKAGSRREERSFNKQSTCKCVLQSNW